MTLSADLLLHAYASGVFPMAESRDDPEVFWVDPKRRGILPLDGFHISRSLARSLRRDDYSIEINRDFSAVVEGCAARDETWINEEIFDRYHELHEMGFAHSLEVWGETGLIGGVYGVSLGGAFFGESMFSRRRDASKIALAYLIDRLDRAGYLLCDTQFITPHLASLGGQEISRACYRRLLAEALQKEASFLAPAIPSPQALLQRRTQTS
ncbi:leucyl/phenylalanyl-tRNA--protein transferase [Phaeobacter sp. B1627]|uniref:leucyl/phenylalanyl-tRNA--protein transferase n=1 Tax=Phaeobacter sp. B1627 TaxID=2583809 RepID=UPI00111931C3|nr:leucyl/phenylalanyl-tRNA--protein transferase [Phaeobacter sp. B1627]TNJ43927.1 leucyl/phenylalanyl-tRNA--protein transferase [Phaeobacter sp. B1627]